MPLSCSKPVQCGLLGGQKGGKLCKNWILSLLQHSCLIIFSKPSFAEKWSTAMRCSMDHSTFNQKQHPYHLSSSKYKIPHLIVKQYLDIFIKTFFVTFWFHSYYIEKKIEIGNTFFACCISEWSQPWDIRELLGVIFCLN